ncbi:MAG TPA: hypothetical protein VFB46_09775 [Gemmatimonadaceae bacterium]|nr:hypothetical protein [Gemmatimonadaceae bacterium]
MRPEVAQGGDMPESAFRAKVFLISPATAHGPRALSLRRADARSLLARRLREGGAPLGEVFSFLSGLYFRGKLEYARAFAHAPQVEGGAVHVITMTDGLVSPDVSISSSDLERYASCIDGTAAAVTRLEETAAAVARAVGEEGDVILLGSVNTGKYTDLLTPIFGGRLLFPRDVLHIGQLARGALFLRHARERLELDYVPVADIQRRGGRASITSGGEPPRRVSSGTPLPDAPPSTAGARGEFPR